MKQNFVSLHPYLKAHRGKFDVVRAAFQQFVQKTGSEKEVLFYGFTVNGDEFLCREAYQTAAGLLTHLNNVDALLKELLKIADLNRLEVHGPAPELEKLKASLAHLNPAYFTLEASLAESSKQRPGLPGAE
jgi:quinol monooxygenase YgiN